MFQPFCYCIIPWRILSFDKKNMKIKFYMIYIQLPNLSLYWKTTSSFYNIFRQITNAILYVPTTSKIMILFFGKFFPTIYFFRPSLPGPRRSSLSVIISLNQVIYFSLYQFYFMDWSPVYTRHHKGRLYIANWFNWKYM